MTQFAGPDGAFRMILEAETDITVVGEARWTARRPVIMAAALRPDVVLNGPSRMARHGRHRRHGPPITAAEGTAKVADPHHLRS